MRPAKRKCGTSGFESNEETILKKVKNMTKLRKQKPAKDNSNEKQQQEEYHCWLMKSEPESRIEKGIDMKIVKEAYADHTQFDEKNPHFDSYSSQDNPRWSMVDVQFIRRLKRYISLSELKKLHLNHKTSEGPLKNMALFTRARLSVQPLTQEEFDFIVSLEDET
ncbi:hypothetical protein GDO86_012916 [Hymenochirus boettgeri]|uniref:Thymocyte nuclear protein 1 n=1 Tax=Hymenochirus boettgeri TaxID=247094 RepID=A0A8T2IP66_9PIPI|nr:hypothetical protein GDO86_012916 [Hymenochirus boettgeri]